MNHRSVRHTFAALLRSKVIRYPILLIILALGLFILAREAHRLKANDFIGYWSASRIIMEGGNPYSVDELLRVQKLGGLTRQQPHIVFNPPWALPFIMLFGALNRQEGQVLWMFAQIGAILFCTNQTWQIYGGQKKKYWVAWFVAFTFGPVVAAIVFQGQISPLILIGLVGFLVYIDKPGKTWIAGAFLVLVLVKPQVPYLFFIAFLLWSIFYKKWSVLIGFISIFALVNIIVLAFDPSIFSQYIQCIQNNAPTAWGTPTIGTYLRLLFSPAKFILVFLPPLMGIAWLVYYLIKKIRVWNWKREMPIILFISTLTSAYIWTYDLVVLLIPVLMSFILILGLKKRWISGAFVIVYIMIDLLYLRLHLILDDLKFIWFAPLILVWYLITQTIHEHSKKMDS